MAYPHVPSRLRSAGPTVLVLLITGMRVVSASPQINVHSPSAELWTQSTDVAFSISVVDPGPAYAFIDWEDSLVGWWRGEGNANDLSSAGNNGTFKGNATTASGIFGQAFSFAASTDYIDVGDANDLDFRPDDSFTVSMWVKRPGTGNAFSCVDKTGALTVYLYANNGYSFGVGGASGVAAWETTTDTTSWAHLVAVYNGQSHQCSVYGNGAHRTAGRSGSAPVFMRSASPLLIGKGNLLVDEVMVFKRALSASEIASLYDATSTNLQASFSGLSEMTPYEYRVHAVNKADGHSESSGSITVDVPDSSPRGIILSPMSPTRSSASGQVFTASVFDTNGDTTLAMATLYWDRGQDFGLTAYTDSLSGNSDTVSISVSDLGSGTITWNLYVEDSRGNGGFIGENQTLLIGQTEYYVAPGGSDQNPGTISEPFATIQHFADMAYPGDTCYIRSGTYRETVTPSRSGNAIAQIHYRAYPGETVVVSGADPVNAGWTQHEGSIYRTTSMNWDLGKGKNQVFVNGTAMMEARWPNTTDIMRPKWSLMGTGSTVSLVDTVYVATIRDDPNLTQPEGTWVGAIMHGTWTYTAHAGIVSAYTPGALTVDLPFPPNLQHNYKMAEDLGSPYYLIGAYAALDTEGEWFYDSDTETLYLWAPGGGDPSSANVEARTSRTYGLDLRGRSYIRVTGIDLFACAVVMDIDSSYNTIDSLKARYVSHQWRVGSYSEMLSVLNGSGVVLDGQNNSLVNSAIDYSSGNGVTLLGENNRVEGCEITNVNYMVAECAAISTGCNKKSSGNQIVGNMLRDSGRDVVYLANGQGYRFLRNVVSGNNCGNEAWDHGCVYTIATDGKGTEIAYNKIHDCQYAAVYFDTGCHNYRVHHNLIYDMTRLHWRYPNYSYPIAVHMNSPATGNHVCHNTLPDTWTNTNASWAPQTFAGSVFKNNVGDWATRANANDYGLVVENNINTRPSLFTGAPYYRKNADTIYVDYANRDYRLRAGTEETPNPARDAGLDLGYTRDILGHFHNSPPDIGAYQYWDGVAPAAYTLSVAAEHGVVGKSPDRGEYSSGESVSLEAVPATGYGFVGWSGDLSGSSNPATVVMDGNKSVTAVFASNVHTLTVAASGGTVTKSPDKAGYEYGESVTLTASADAGYSFSGWSGAASGTNSSVTIVMDGDKSVTANFAAISYTLSIAATNGSVAASPQKAGYSYNESVSLQAVPNTGYHFTGWSGSLSGSTNPASIVMNADKSVTAAFAVNTYTLTTSATNGSVVKSPQAASYTHGATVSLQAVAAEGYEFAGWSGAVSGSANPVEIVMDSSKSVTAAFTVKTYTLTTSATNGSVVRSPESATYAHGSTVSVQAVAAEGYHFTGWSGAVTGSSNPVSLVMDASKSVTAAFAANAYTLSISAANGAVTASPSQATYTHGEVVTLTATPSTGYSFSSWSGDASGTAGSTTVTMDGDKSVTAAFTLNTYTLNISSVNGTVTRDPVQATYTHGQTVTLTAVPATGYSFSSWSGDLSGTVASATITMDGNKSVAAGFTINSYTLNTSGANGSITKNPDKSTYNHGETVTLQAVPAEGYNFVNWSGDLAGSANPATLVMDSNKTVAAAFATNTYTLQTNATNGSVTRTPDQASFAHGETVTLTAVPATGYSFSGWSGDASGSTATVTITMNADKSVTAGFTANAYTLSVSASNGSVTVNPIRATYAHGEVVTLTAVPSVGHSFGSWSGDASGTATSTTVTMDSNKSVTAAFALNTYTLSVTSANGTVTKNPSQATYNHGDTVALTAEPAEGYEFAGWSGDLTGSSNPATLTMTGNKSVTAHFTAVSNDNEPPVLFGFSPLADAIQVPLNSLVLLRITDAGDGVDANTVTIRVNDNVVYAGNVASASGVHGVCRRVGTPAHYVYAFQPVEDFDYDSTVAVTVNAVDLAGNAMAQQSYSFRTQMRTFGSNHCASWGPDGLDKGGAATVCDAGGNVWVVWHAGDAGSRDIYIARLTSGVEQFSGPIQLTSNTSDQCNPDIAIGANGRLFVVWQDNRRGNWDIYLRTSADGVTWSSEIEATDFTNDETNPVIAVDARSPSYAYIAWQDNRAGNQDIYVASSSTNFASKTVTRVTSNVQDQIGPRIAVDGANGVYLVWTDFRNGAADVYGAASSSGPWTNVAVATGAGSQSAPDIAAEPGGYSLHFVWVNRVDNQDDVFYGISIGLPASPLAGINIIDDTSSADQRRPAIVAAGSGGTARVFAAWQDFRNAADGLDTDLYAAEIKDGSVTNLFVGDGWTRTNQTEPCIGVDLFGRPYVVWTDERNAKDDIYFAASTFVEPTPLDVRMVVGATGGTVGVASPTQLDDVSVVIPAGACAYDVTVSIARIWNLEPGLPADILPYEFGPSGLQFEAPVTITIPYAVADFPGDPPQPYWYDAMTGAMSQQGITNIQYVALSSTLHALRFQTTHFTPYAVVGEVEEGIVPTGGSSGGGCSLSPAAAGASGVLEYFVPFTALAVIMFGLRRRDVRRRRGDAKEIGSLQ